MRRVYYAFALRLATHPITLHVVFLVAALYALAALVHVEMVLRNIAVVEVGNLVPHLAKILMNADTATIMVLGITTFVLASLPFRLPQYQRLQMS